MNITKFEANQTMMMSSREIASLTGSSHDNVLKTIRSLVKQGVVSVNETTYIHEQNKQEYVMYLLDYRNTMVVVSGYSVELRARIIDRWQELENQVKQPKLPTTYLEALKALVVSEEQNVIFIEQNKQLETTVAEKQRQIAIYEKALPDECGNTPTAVAKILGLKPNLFIETLSNAGYIYKMSTDRTWTGKAYYMEKGWFTNPKIGCPDGIRRTTFRITNLGIKRLTEHIAQGKIDVSDIRI